MKKYLSYGGGVNSTVLLILLTEQGEEFEAVFADHGGDYPETYSYLAMLQERYPITIVKARQEDKDLYDYAMSKNAIPSRMLRWCTDKFKIRPIKEYIKTPCIMYIGFDAGEIRRVSGRTKIPDVDYRYPLIEMGYDRDDCIRIIKDAGLPIPRKSGCYFCPFQRIGEYRTLRDERPDLYCKAKTLEENCNRGRIKRGKEPIYLSSKPIDEAVQEGQDDLFGYRKPCQCGL